MKKCKINITIGTGSYVVEVDSTQLPGTLEELKSLLRKSESWKDIKADIRKSLLQRKTIDPVKITEIESQSKVIPNTTTEVLMSKYPYFNFPEGEEIKKIPVLFVNKYETLKDGNLWGRYTEDGKEVFIVDRKHVKDFADYLSIRKIIDELDKTKQSKELSDRMQKCLEVAKETFNVKDAKELMFRFIHDKKNFRKSDLMVGENTLASELEDICDTIFENFGFFRESHSDSLVNNIAHAVDYKNKKILLSKNTLYSLLQQAKVLNFDSEKSFRKFFNRSPKEIKQLLLDENVKDKHKIQDDVTLNNIKKLFEGEIATEDSWEVLVKNILARDKTFKVSYSENNKDNIILSNYVNFKSQGIYMPDFKGLEIPKYYHGKYITKVTKGTDTVEYYVTSNYPQDTSKVTYFQTEGQAKRYIDEMERTVSATSRLNIHYLEQDENGNFISEDSYRRQVKGIGRVSEGAILTVLDYDLVKPKRISAEENNFIIGRGLMSEFDEYVYKLKKYNTESKSTQNLFLSEDRTKIVEKLNTPEKIAIFVSEIARLREKYTDGVLLEEDSKYLLEQVLPKLDDDGDIKYKYYYVYEVKGNTTTLIPIDGVTTLQEYQQKDKNIPVARMWEAISEGMSPLLKTQVNVLTAQQIQDKFKDYSDKKAFIKDGQIYINISNASTRDLMHEYAHIILAYLKNNSEYRDAYKNLLQSVWDVTGQTIKNQIISDYENYSQEDIMEELFVSQFGNWIENNNIKYDDIFRNSEGLEQAKRIFDPNNKSKSIKDLFGRSIQEIFTRFNANVSELLQNNQGLMDEQFQKSFTLSRKQSDWIRRRKENKELEEVCE